MSNVHHGSFPVNIGIQKQLLLEFPTYLLGPANLADPEHLPVHLAVERLTQAAHTPQARHSSMHCHCWAVPGPFPKTHHESTHLFPATSNPANPSFGAPGCSSGLKALLPSIQMRSISSGDATRVLASTPLPAFDTFPPVSPLLLAYFSLPPRRQGLSHPLLELGFALLLPFDLEPFALLSGRSPCPMQGKGAWPFMWQRREKRRYSSWIAPTEPPPLQADCNAVNHCSLALPVSPQK